MIHTLRCFREHFVFLQEPQRSSQSPVRMDAANGDALLTRLQVRCSGLPCCAPLQLAITACCPGAGRAFICSIVDVQGPPKKTEVQATKGILKLTRV